MNDFLKNLLGEKDLTEDINAYNQALTEARNKAPETSTNINPDLYKQMLERVSNENSQRDMLTNRLKSTLKY